MRFVSPKSRTSPTGLRNEDVNTNTKITTNNTTVTGAAIKILRNERRRQKPWITRDVYKNIGSFCTIKLTHIFCQAIHLQFHRMHNSTNNVISNLTCMNHNTSQKSKLWQFGTGAPVSFLAHGTLVFDTDRSVFFLFFFFLFVCFNLSRVSLSG